MRREVAGTRHMEVYEMVCSKESFVLKILEEVFL